MTAPVVVGVDGSASALRATAWAAAESRRRGVPLRLVHACAPPALDRPADEQRSIADLSAEGAEALRVAAASVPGAEVCTELLVGPPDQVLVDESTRATAVVLGHRGTSAFNGTRVGSVATALAGRGRCPVVVVRGEAAGHGPVVLGVDATAASEAAIGYAFEAAALRGTAVIAVRTWLDVEFAGTWRSLPPSSDRPAITASERADLIDRLDPWTDRYPAVAVERVVVCDRPVRALVDHAAGAVLVVVGARGTGGFTGMGLGSTSLALLHQAPCPVAVVRPG